MEKPFRIFDEVQPQLTHKVAGRGTEWDQPSMEVFDVLGYRFNREGKGAQGVERHCEKEWEVGGVSFIIIYRSRSLPLKTKCQGVFSNVFSTALNGSVNWHGTLLGNKNHAFDSPTKMLSGEEWITYKARTIRVKRSKWKEMGLASLADLCAEKCGNRCRGLVTTGQFRL